MSFRFVHAADLHLDSPFKGLSSVDADLGRTLQTATFAAFDNIVDLCLAERAAALIVAGDVFDGADRSLKAQLAFQAGLSRLADAGIHSFVAHGNHDPLDGWRASLTFPPLVHRFGPAVEQQSIAVDGLDVAVHGFSYPRRVVLENVARQFRAARAADLNVAVLHGTVGTQPGHDPYAPCSLDDLHASGMDYWAMGHVHERQVVRPARPAVVYPGNPQGRHPRERGPRGVYVVELEPGLPPALEFRPVDVVRWERLDVRIEDIATEQELLDALLEAGGALAGAAGGRMVMAGASLSGAGPLHESLRRPGVGEELLRHANGTLAARSQRIFFTGLEDRSRGSDQADRGGGFLDELLAEAEMLRRDPVSELEPALSELLHHPALRFLDGPDEADYRELVDAALELALDTLHEAAR